MLDVTRKHPDLDAVVDVTTDIEQIATGFDFLEGPIWHPTYQSVLFSDIMGNSLYSWNAQDGVTQRRRNSYMANGNAYDHSGRFVTCEHATSRLTRTDLTTDTYEVLASHYLGRELNSPNDVVVKRDGTIWFTDPVSGRSEGYGVPREPVLDFSGVYCYDPATQRLTCVVKDFAKPNGLCFSADESVLFINDTVRQHIRCFDVNADNTLSNGRLFADLEGSAPGVADGMKIDQDANVYSCGPGGVHVFKQDGTALGVINMPEHTANFVFGDEDGKSLYITASKSLYRIRTHVPGYFTYQPK